MSKATDTTAKNLREVHANAETINKYLAAISYEPVDGVRLVCHALAECIKEFGNYTQASEPQECADRAADTLASVREILEK